MSKPKPQPEPKEPNPQERREVAAEQVANPVLPSKTRFYPWSDPTEPLPPSDDDVRRMGIV